GDDGGTAGDGTAGDRGQGTGDSRHGPRPVLTRHLALSTQHSRTLVPSHSRTPQMRHATITGTGSFVPARVVANAELSAALGEDIDAFVANTLGIRERHWCAPDESTADLAEQAARAALADAGLAAEDVDLLIVSTDTPEYV